MPPSEPETTDPNKGTFNLDFVTKVMEHFGHSGFLAVRYVGHGDDWVEMAIDWRNDLVADTDSGVLASAAVVSLMDNATSMAVWQKLAEFRPHATMDLRVDYLRPSPKGARLFARGRCYHLTKTVGFVSGIAHNGNIDDPLATASGTFIRTGDRVG